MNTILTIIPLMLGWWELFITLFIFVFPVIIIIAYVRYDKKKRTQIATPDNKSRVIWIVKKTRSMREEQFSIICGVYDDETKAKARVNEIFEETMQFYKRTYTETKQKFKSENSGNGYATVRLIADEDYDTTEITAASYTLNEGTYEDI